MASASVGRNNALGGTPRGRDFSKRPTRTHTANFKRIRQSQSTYSDDGPYGSPTADMESNYNDPNSLPRWFAYKDSLESTFSRVESDLQRLKECEEASTDAFSSNEIERNNFMRSISNNLKRAEQSLRLVHSKQHFSKDPSENILRQNLKQFFSQKLFAYTKQFQVTQKQQLNTKMKSDNYKREAAAEFIQIEEEEMTDAQVNMLATDSALYTSRHKDIVQIAKSVQEISVLFNKLGQLVVEQGTVVDRIDYHCTVALDDTKEGVVKLQEAEQEQKKNLGIKFIAVMTAIVTVLACFLIIKVTKFP